MKIIQISRSRFSYALDARRGASQQNVLRDPVEKSDVLWEAVSTFLAPAEQLGENSKVTVESRQFLEGLKLLRGLLNPIRVYLHLRDKDFMKITSAHAATLALEAELMRYLAGAQNAVATVPEARIHAMATVIRQRINGPQTRHVIFVLLQDIHFLTAVVKPLSPQNLFSQLLIHATLAFGKLWWTALSCSQRMS